MHRKHLIGFTFALLAVIACGREDAPAENPSTDDAAATESNTGSSTEAPPLPIGDNSRTSLDWAGQYVLEKHVHDPAIEDKRWKLVELRGERVEAGRAAQDAVFTLRAGESIAAGSASCNTFSALYAIKSGQRIRFGRNMAVTMMACPDMSLESEFFDVLKQVDNYSLGDDGGLSLNRARMAPLARFDQLPASLPRGDRRGTEHDA